MHVAHVEQQKLREQRAAAAASFFAVAAALGQVGDYFEAVELDSGVFVAHRRSLLVRQGGAGGGHLGLGHSAALLQLDGVRQDVAAMITASNLQH